MLGKAWYSLGTRSCWKSPNLNHFDIKHIASLKEAILENFVERANSNVDGNFLHLATALDPQWKDLKESSREGCLRKMRAALDLLKGEEGVARDKVDAPKPKKDCLTSTNLTMIVMERARLMSSPVF